MRDFISLPRTVTTSMDAATELSARCCCFVENDRDQINGSGIIFRFTAASGADLTPQELQKRLPGVNVDLAGRLETTWAILVCHRVVPGIDGGEPLSSHLKIGPKLHFKQCHGDEVHTLHLHEMVSGSVSCCGKHCIINMGTGDNVLRSPHGPYVTLPDGKPRRNYCTIDLDFTILFINEQFEEKINQLIPEPVTIPCDRVLLNEQLQLLKSSLCMCYVCDRTGLVKQQAIELCVSNEPLLFPEAPTGSLRDKINKFKAVQRLHYNYSDTKGSKTPPGGPIFLNKEDGSAELLGFHVQNSEDSLVGTCNTIYGIVCLLQGKYKLNKINCNLHACANKMADSLSEFS